MKTSIWASALLVLIVFTGSAEAAIYAKYDGVDGSSMVGKPVILDGTKNQDDGTISRFSWTQVSGPTAQLSGGTTLKPTFTPSTPGTYVFQLTVTYSSGRTISEKIEIKTSAAAAQLQIVSPISGTAANPAPPPPPPPPAPPPSSSGIEYSWKVEEGEKLTPVLLELDGVPGESSERPKPKPQESGEKGGTEDINIGVGELQEGKVNKVDSIAIKQGSMQGGVSVAAGDVNGLTEEEKTAFLARVKDHAQVHSDEDLSNFARGVLLENAQMEEIALNYEEIKVTHRARGKLFGLIPLTFRQEVELSSDGTVKVKLPWFGFLLRPEVDAQAAMIGSSNGGVWKTTNEQAAVLAELSNVLKLLSE
jgi:hypothetical protein